MSTTGSVGDVLTVTAAGVLGYAAAPPSASIAGGASSQILYQIAPNVTGFIANGATGQPLVSNGAAVPSWGQISLTAAVTGVLPIANGGTNSTTQQGAINNLAGSTAAGSYLRGNGGNVVMSPIQVSDVPTLNQNTTGTAANVTGVVAIANGGTGQTTQTAAINALLPSQASAAGDFLKSDGTNVSWATIPITQWALATGGPGTTNLVAQSGFSSITRSAQGVYSVSFSTPTPNTNYLVFISCSPAISAQGNGTQNIATPFSAGNGSYVAPTTSGFSFFVNSPGSGDIDPRFIMIQVLNG
jgi:hypothetical protein